MLGTLLDLVEIDDGWEPAVEAALGESLTAVVVDDASAGRRALGRLRSSDTSGAVIALGARPLEPGPHRRSASRSAPTPDRDGRASTRCSTACWARPCASTMSALRSTPRSAIPDIVIVTGGGDRFGLSGWRVGAAGSGATASALDDAIERAEHAAAELQRAVEDVEAADRNVQAAAIRARPTWSAGSTTTTPSSALPPKGWPAPNASTARSQRSWRVCDRSIADLSANLDREDQRIAELEALLPAFEADEQAEADAARARGELRADLEARAAAMAPRRKDLEVRNAGLHERRQFLERRLDETERRLAADAEARLAAEVSGSVSSATSLRSIGSWPWCPAIVRSSRCSTPISSSSAVARATRCAGLTGELDQHRRARAEKESALDASRERARQAEIGEAEAKLRLETAIETLRRELDIEPAVAEAAPMPVLPEGATPAGRVRELERELRLLGPDQPARARGVQRAPGPPHVPRRAARGRPFHPPRAGAG